MTVNKRNFIVETEVVNLYIYTPTYTHAHRHPHTSTHTPTHRRLMGTDLLTSHRQLARKVLLPKGTSFTDEVEG